MPKIPIVDFCPSDVSQVYDQYMSYLNDHSPNVIIDFKNLPISSYDSSAIFGRLLITDARRSVLCKNLNTDITNVTNLFQGVNETFHSDFPHGIGPILEPQIELYDPSGEGEVIVVKLGRDAYEAVRRQNLAKIRTRH